MNFFASRNLNHVRKYVRIWMTGLDVQNREKEGNTPCSMLKCMVGTEISRLEKIVLAFLERKKNRRQVYIYNIRCSDLVLFLFYHMAAFHE